MTTARVTRPAVRESTETRPYSRSSEFYVYLVAAAAVLIAGLVLEGFNATEAWRFFTYLSVGYMISRGLAKAGSSDPYRPDDRGDDDRDRPGP